MQTLLKHIVGLDGPAGPGGHNSRYTTYRSMGDTALSRSQRRPGSAKWPSEYPLHLVAWQEKLVAQQLLEHDAIIRLRK